MNELQQILAAIENAPAGDAVLVTLVDVEGSSYRRPGARLLLTKDDQRIGSISGGCLEDDVIAHAQRVRTSGRPTMVIYDTTSENDLVWGVGSGCHGIVHLLEKLPLSPAWVSALRDNTLRRAPTELATIWRGPAGIVLGTCLASALPPESDISAFRQTVFPPAALTIFGAGDDAGPLVRFAKELGWEVTIVDARPAFATPGRFPEADAVIVARPEEAVARINPAADSAAVIMTHHYRHDVPLLRTLLPRPLAYLGVLGPKKRTDMILADIEADGLAISAAMRARLRAPVGLDLGADNPEEIALSILAEMTAVLAGRDARPLRERPGPIHAG